MTDPYSGFSAATPFQHGRSTAQLRSEFTVPATRDSLMKRHSRNTVVPSGPQVASGPEMCVVRPTLNTTPHSLCTISSSKIWEGERSPDPRIQQELEDNIIEVKTDAFVLAVLYKGAVTKMKEDANMATICLDTLQDCSPQRPTTLSTSSHPTGSTPASLPPISDVPIYDQGRFFALLPTYHRRESDMYRSYVGLLNYVSRFFRARIEDVDGAWLPAQQPSIPTASQNAGPPLNRVFRDMHNQPRLFSRNNQGQAGLKPDICLLVESEGKPKVAAHWKDVLVPIEVQKEQDMDMEVLVRVAHYACSVMLEQFDRNFAFTVLLTGEVCRVFHWDVVGVQVTEPFNFHKNPELFLQVMGRLATMTPSELGYDTHFSNAGRVLSSETDIRTHLTIHSSKPRPFFNHDPKFSTLKCPDDTPSLVLELKKMQFESKDILFNWATRVWRAVVVNNPPEHEQCTWSKGATYIVKQNWADDRQPNEGFFYKVAHEVKVVPQLVTMEEREFTSSFRARFNRSEVLGVLPLVRAEHPRKSALRSQSVLGGDPSHPYDQASKGVGDADVSDEGEGMRVDDVGGSAADVGDEGDVGDNEDVADQKVASKMDMGDEDVNGGIRRSLERVLLRFVFDREGRSLSEAKDSIRTSPSH